MVTETHRNSLLRLYMRKCHKRIFNDADVKVLLLMIYRTALLHAHDVIYDENLFSPLMYGVAMAIN